LPTQGTESATTQKHAEPRRTSDRTTGATKEAANGKIERTTARSQTGSPPVSKVVDARPQVHENTPLEPESSVLQLQTSKKEHVGKEKNDDAIPLRDTETVPKSGIDVMAKLLLSASSISEGGSGKPQYDPKNFVIIDLGGADAAATGKGFVHRDLSGADQNVAATPPKSSGPHEYVLVDVSLDDGLKGQKFTMGEVNAAAADLVRAKYDKVVLASVKVTGTDEKGSGITSESVQFRSKPVAALQKGGDEKKKDKTDWGKIGGLIGGTVLVLAILGAAIAMGNGSQGAPLPESEIRATSAIDESPAPEAGGSPDGEAKATV